MRPGVRTVRSAEVASGRTAAAGIIRRLGVEAGKTHESGLTNSASEGSVHVRPARCRQSGVAGRTGTTGTEAAVMLYSGDTRHDAVQAGSRIDRNCRRITMTIDAGRAGKGDAPIRGPGGMTAKTKVSRAAAGLRPAVIGVVGDGIRMGKDHSCFTSGCIRAINQAGLEADMRRCGRNRAMTLGTGLRCADMIAMAG